MTATESINRVRGALGDHLVGFEHKSERRVFLEIAPETVQEASSVMFEEMGARLQIMTGIDTPAGIEVMYHWALDADDCVVTVRTTVPHDQPLLDSISGFCPAAEWIEREIWELLGVEFPGHSDLRHLLLDDDWPEGEWPLRKGFGGRAGAEAIAAEAAPTARDEPAEPGKSRRVGSTARDEPAEPGKSRRVGSTARDEPAEPGKSRRVG
ncbi:MAG: NADH-quinone oxidoreductase subunit C, partial [Gammaproteobacteria bacterium]|nr:NADH-quinone oxidoreductase subunit C [Gammaproteobacteria bacterium]